MKYIEILKEELKDIPKTNAVYHRTNEYALKSILKNGYLKATSVEPEKNFNVLKPKERSVFLSTARKATFSFIDSLRKRGYEKEADRASMDLSPQIENVEFELYTDRIIGSHLTRNIKRKKVAEFPQMSKKEGIELIKNLMNTINSDNPYAISKDLEKIQVIKDFIEEADHKAEKLFHLLVRMIRSENGKEKVVKNFPRDLVYRIYDYMKVSGPEAREGEERLYSKKQDELKIPLDERFMKIRFVGKTKEKSKNILEIIKEKKDLPDSFLNSFIETKQLIKKHENLFDKNENFYAYMNMLNAITYKKERQRA